MVYVYCMFFSNFLGLKVIRFYEFISHLAQISELLSLLFFLFSEVSHVLAFFIKRQGWMVALLAMAVLLGSYFDHQCFANLFESTTKFLSTWDISHILTFFLSFIGTRTQGCCRQCLIWSTKETSRHKENGRHPACVRKASETAKRGCWQERLTTRFLPNFFNCACGK